MGPKEVLHTWFERVWNQGDESAIEELFSPTGVAHGLPGGPIEGPAAFKPFARSFRSAFPNMKIILSQSLIEGDLCAVYCEVKGTHTGNGLGFAASGREVTFIGIVIARVDNGQIQEAWNSFDFLSLYQQLGLVPQIPN